MLNIEATTKLSPEDVIKQAVEYFGPQGYGLAVKEQGTGYAEFEGGGGGVEVNAMPKEKGSTVSFMSREWDYQVKAFIDKLK